MISLTLMVTLTSDSFFSLLVENEFLLEESLRERLRGKIEGDLTVAKWRLLTALMTARNAFDRVLLCGFFATERENSIGVRVGFSAGPRGNDLNPLEEHELKSSERKSLSMVGLRSMGNCFLCLGYVRSEEEAMDESADFGKKRKEEKKRWKWGVNSESGRKSIEKEKKKSSGGFWVLVLHLGFL